MRESIRVGSVRGIAIRLHWSVLAVAGLLARGLADGFPPAAAPGYRSTAAGTSTPGSGSAPGTATGRPGSPPPSGGSPGGARSAAASRSSCSARGVARGSPCSGGSSSGPPRRSPPTRSSRTPRRADHPPAAALARPGHPLGVLGRRRHAPDRGRGARGTDGRRARDPVPRARPRRETARVRRRRTRRHHVAERPPAGDRTRPTAEPRRTGRQRLAATSAAYSGCRRAIPRRVTHQTTSIPTTPASAVSAVSTRTAPSSAARA